MSGLESSETDQRMVPPFLSRKFWSCVRAVRVWKSHRIRDKILKEKDGKTVTCTVSKLV